MESVRPLVTSDSRKAKFSAATVVDSFVLFGIRADRCGVRAVGDFRVGFVLAGTFSYPKQNYIVFLSCFPGDKMSFKLEDSCEG